MKKQNKKHENQLKQLSHFDLGSLPEELQKELKDDFQKLNEYIDELNLFMGYPNKTLVKKVNMERDWITLKEFIEYYSVSRTAWYEKYKEFIKWRMDGKLLIYKPSMDKYLFDKSIN
jgi:hypothetical protein